MKSKSILLWVFLSASMLYGCIGGKSSVKSQRPYAVDDNDTVCVGNLPFAVPGSTYNAINPMYIVNRSGITLYDKGVASIMFTLSAPARYVAQNAVDDAETWDYKINGMPLWKEMRHIASALMPQAIICAEYIPYEKPDGKVKGYMDIKTCHPDKLKTDARHTLYLLNGIKITEKIFEAVNPVYIKSLKRITDEQELKRFGGKDLKNIVMIETFSYEDLIAPQQIYWIKENDLLDLYLVNGIRLNKKSFDAINKTFCNEWYRFFNDDKRAIPYLKKYPNAGSIEVGIIE